MKTNIITGSIKHCRKHRVICNSVIVFGGLLLFFFFLNILFPLRINISYSQIITARDGSVLYASLSSDDKWRLKTELNEITPQLKRAIICKEDKYFYYHPGINPVAIARAVFNNLQAGKKTSGASTITMQVARMLNRKPRSYGNKIIEMFRAVQLEWRYSKEEILQLYLNLVPYGSNIEGVKSASVIYFEQTPDYLSLAQIVTLAIIPNRPTSLVLGKDNDSIVVERNKWLRRFEKEKVFSTEEISDALSELLNAKRHTVPRKAPHISIRLASAYGNQPIIHSTIDKSKQEKVENIAFNYIRRLHYKNITNCAVLVVSNATGEVMAYLGSADFSNRENEGQVDGVRAIRSPGSTLKPFLYALTFDKGMITPKSIITDVPVNYQGYRPENFDEKYRGNVTAESALANSLNVPAVKILDEYGTEKFLSQLSLAGFMNVAANQKSLGLSTVLGGCGVKLEELVQLYSCFANGGEFNRLQYTKEDTAQNKIQLLSPASCFMITEILLQHTRPDLPHNYESSFHLPKIAWKTGTSYGRRDAWSIGYNKEYTIGVWVGNFNNKGVPELTGADIATPLLFDIFNSIDYNSPNEWWRAPEELDFRYVCSHTGLIPGDSCAEVVMDYFIPGVSLMQQCNHLKEINVSADESISYCQNCLPETGYKKKWFPNLPPELISFYESESIPYTKVPAHNPDCTRIYVAHAPVITSPTDGMEYILEKNSEQQLQLSCNTENDVEKVYWYINNQFLQSAGAHEQIFFTPVTGDVKISCTDDKGRNTNVTITVTRME